MGCPARCVIRPPLVWTRRRKWHSPGSSEEWPTLSKPALLGEGFDVIERRQPSQLHDGSVLITARWTARPISSTACPQRTNAGPAHSGSLTRLVLDDQALIGRGQGLVAITGCGHAGAVNIVPHASWLTGVSRLHALLGGLHLNDAFFAPSIDPTVRVLTELRPDPLVPRHCTGWQAKHALAAA